MSSNFVSSQPPLPQKSRQRISPRSTHARPPHPSADPQRPVRVSIDDEYVFVKMDEPAEYPYSFPITTGGSPRHSVTADSTQSHDPLLVAPPQSARTPVSATEEEGPLLTLNTLDPVQRAALVRQSRKLHKLLGATPHISDIQASARPPVRKLQRRGTLAGSDIRLDRNAALAALESPPLEPPASANWAKIPSSLVATAASSASTNAPVLTLNVVSSPGDVPYPIRPRRLSDSSVASSAASTILRRLGSTTSISNPYRPSDDGHEPANDSSSKNAPASAHPFYMPPSPTSPLPHHVSSSLQRQQSRARMAKLQQIMGEPVPSELVMRPQKGAGMASQTSNSGRSRRLSMDLSSPTKATPSLKHKRSRTMWRKDLKENLEFDSAPESFSSPTKPVKRHGKSKSKDMPPIEDLLLGQLQKGPMMTGKQKALNVKRALKMAAVFGVPPPQILYQVSNKVPDSPMTSPLASQQSLASLAYMLDHDRDSLYDLLASTADSGSDEEEDPVDWPYERKSTSSPPPEAPQSEGSSGNVKVTTAGRVSANLLSIPFQNSRPGSPSKPSPLSLPATAADDSNTKLKSPQPRSPVREREFSSRRRRANKLSRFFGVNYNDLFNSMVYSPEFSEKGEVPAVPPLPTGSPVAPSSSGSNAAKVSAAPSAWNGPKRTTSMRDNNAQLSSLGVSRSQVSLARNAAVSVQTGGGKATVLRTSANIAADVDADELDDVMARLRALKA